MSEIEKLSIALTAELAAEVRAAVESGQYASVSEVIRDALRQWSSKRKDDAYIVQGVASGEPLERPPLEEFLQEMHARLAKMRAA